MMTTMSMSRVDSHHHVWTLARGDYGWLTPSLAAIYRDFTLADLAPLAREAGIGATVLVQAAPTVAETRFLLEVARASGGSVQAVVGWVDLAATDADAVLAELARDALLRSVRPMLQDLPDPEWVLREGVVRALSALPPLGLRFDALVKPTQLRALLELGELLPELDVVIDHGAKPPIAQGAWQPWAELIAAAAANPRWHCKLSGLATEASADWTADTLARYVDHLLEAFGPSRLMWGSDWPVVELAGGYCRWLAATTELLSGLGDDEREAILGVNARRFYGFD
jgi:L-fucono-1,5-lactonase